LARSCEFYVSDRGSLDKLTLAYRSRTEDSIKEFQNKLDKKKGEIIQIQASAQQAAGGQSQQAAS